MPTYVYHCDNCGHDFEQFQKFSDAPIEICPVCLTKHVRKVPQAAGIQFKGSGWYVNDSRSSNSSSKPASEAKPAESTPSTSDSSKNDSKTSSSSTSSDE